MTPPPQNLEMERSAIGACLIEKWACRRVLHMLKVEDFYSEANRVTFQAIADLSAESAELPIDHASVIAQLAKNKTLEVAGGPAAVIATTDLIGSVDAVDRYVKFVREASLQRQILRLVEDVKTEASPKNLKHLTDAALSLQGNRGVRIFDFRQIDDVGNAVEAITDRQKPGIKIGFDGFDDLTNGSQPGELWTIGARPGAGKTAFMLMAACWLASRGTEVTFYTTEMSRLDIFRRVVSMASGIRHWKFRAGQLGPDDVRRIITLAADDFPHLSLKVVDSSNPSIDDLRAAVYQTRPQVAFFDYLQRFRLPKAENMAYQIGEFMRELKTFCLDTQILGFIGAQTDRELDRFPDMAPTMSHLKGSGAIESESDGVVMLWEPSQNVIAKREEWVPPRPGRRAVEGIIRKNRNGERNVSFDLELEGELIRLTDRKREPQQGELDHG